MTQTVLITGSSGLVGSACVRHFAALGWVVYGADNGGRKRFFGCDGDVEANRRQLFRDAAYCSVLADVRGQAEVMELVSKVRPDLVIHCAAQPSHDYAASHPFEDFYTNALGTLNLLEACRRHAPDAVFVHLSTNKVYGDAVNRLPLVEHPTRFEYDPLTPHARHGIGEWMSVDASLHSLFGCSKLYADVTVQEYGRNFGMRTTCLRCGCLTGAAHAAAEQHGFLAYLARCCREGRPYRVYGHHGKQVRDNLHATDAARACEAIYRNPRAGAVYNLGGGRDNSCSVLEAIAEVEQRCGRRLQWEYVDQPRRGDHVVWYSDCRRFTTDYPEWQVRVRLSEIFGELCGEVCGAEGAR